MARTLQETINWAQAYTGGLPLNLWTGSEPAVSIANILISTITAAPFTWGWNRNENTTLTLSTPTQDYTVNITDFGYLEKLSLVNVGATYSYEIRDVYNTNILGVSVTEPAQPNAVAVRMITPGTSVSLRFLPIPDQNYTTTITYQKAVTPLTATTDNWPFPDSYVDIYNNLFLAEAFEVAYMDQDAARYRMRGVTALLAKAEGLTEMQRNAFLNMFLARDSQTAAMILKTQQGSQARGV